MNQRRTPTLLIVDDDPALRRLLSWTFEELGYWVWSAHDCREAIASASAMAFDFALLDYHLPDGTGEYLAYALSRQIPTLQIVIISADVDAVSADAPWTSVGKPLSVAWVHRRFSALHRGRSQSTALARP